MKKFLAILLSAVMLCSVIPFAAISVSAEGEYYIELVANAEEVNAGDEISVAVSLYGHEEVGMIAALLKLSFDPTVFELETYYDEDEGMWIPPLEVGPKFNASSNKYITFPQINEETGHMNVCSVQFQRATATAAQAVKTNLFYTATFKVKDDAISGNYTIDIADYKDKNLIMHGNAYTTWTWEPITIKVNGTEPACRHEYDSDCDVDCNLCYETREVSHSVTYAEAVTPTCVANGNVEHWYCDVCGMAWLDAECSRNTNLKAVVLPATGEHIYNYACDQYCNECGEKTNPGAKHNIVHVEAKEPVSCIEYGNKEYWHCDACGAAWLDEACRYQTNMMSVLTAGPCVSNAEFACQDGECINCTLPCLAEVAHTYDNNNDLNCNVCGAIRSLAATDIVAFDGKSLQENKYGTGLAFKFNAVVNGIKIGDDYIADYSNAKVTIDGVEYKLIKMGAIVNNLRMDNLTLADVDNSHIKNVEAVKVFDESSFAVRILSIPDDQKNTTIFARPYYIYEDAEGEQITVYDDDQYASYNDVANG